LPLHCPTPRLHSPTSAFPLSLFIDVSFLLFQEDLFLDEFGIKCDKADNSDKCYKTRCTKGCAQWYRALKDIEPCQEACASTQFYPYDLPCIGACETSQRDYWHLQRLAMAKLVESTQPQLLEPSSDSGALTVKWSIQFPENFLASRPFNIQYQQLDQLTELAWRNLADYDCDEYYVCEILEALIPYSRYRFRFELPFGEGHSDVLYSPATPIYETPIEGAPISAPSIESVLALDEHHVALHWRPGRYSNAPLEGYKLQLSGGSNDSREQLLPAQRTSCIFGQLQPLTNYSLSLSMINKQGQGPPAVASIQTKAPLESQQLLSVLLASRRQVVWQSLEPAGETRVVYRSSEQANISDLAWSQREQRLWLLDSLGQLHSQLLDEPATSSARALRLQLPGSWTARKVSLDWLRQRLYLAAEAGDGAEYELFSCSTEGDDVEKLNAQLGETVQQLEVDALNGWLFWSDGESLHRLDLSSKDALRVGPAQTRLGNFVLEPQRWLLHVLLLEEQQLLELSYDGSYKQLRPLRDESWLSFALSVDQKQLLLINDSKLEMQSKTSSWTMQRDEQELLQEEIFDIVALERRRQPLALEPAQPQRLRAMLGAQAAKISWRPPALNPYQTLSVANFSYELEVLDVGSQSAYNIRNIRQLSFGLERLQPNNLYQLRVRAINQAGWAGEWTQQIATRSWPLGEHRLRWATRQGRLYMTNELGDQLKALPAKLAPAPSPLVLVNESVAYYISEQTLYCVHRLEPQLSCGSLNRLQQVSSVAYDWRGGMLYWTDLARNMVQRMDPLTGERELLPIFGARQLALDAEHGQLYYSSEAHLASRTLNTQQELEFYHVNGLTGRIRNFCLDLQHRYLYWLVEGSSSGSGSDSSSQLLVYRSALSMDRSLELLTTLSSIDALPHTLQHWQPLNALAWIAGDGSAAHLLRLDETSRGTQPLQPLGLGLNASLTALQLLSDKAYPSPDQSVRPLPVAVESVRIEPGGHWNDFRLRWQPTHTAGNHSISYKLLLEQGGERVLSLELATSFARITQLSQAMLPLRVSLTPHSAWRAGPTTRLTLATPLAAPTQPRRLRVFVERRAQALQTGVNISALLRWDVPEEEQQTALQYRISCWHGADLHAELLLNQTQLEARIGQLRPDETYRFQVQAQQSTAATSHTLHIAPELQAVPRLLYANAEHIGEFDLDLARRQQLVYTANPVEHLVTIEGEQRLLWVNEHVELLSHVPGQVPAKLARMRAEVLALTVDWVQRVVYWAELDQLPAADRLPAACIYRLDLCRFEARILPGERLWCTPRGELLRDLMALPHARALIWLQHSLNERNGTLRGRSLANATDLHFQGLTQSLWRLFEGSQQPSEETVNLVDDLGRLCIYHIHRQLCTPSSLSAQLNLLNENILQLAQDSGYLYALRNGSLRAFGRRRQQLEYLLPLSFDEVRLLRSYNYQAYPDRHCLLLPASWSAQHEQLASSCDETNCTLQLPHLTAAPDCLLPIPGLGYQLNLTASQSNSSELRSFKGFAGQSLGIAGLKPFHSYELGVSLSSYYQTVLKLEPLLVLPKQQLRTAPATPTAPRNFSARALSPNELEVSWLAPLQLRSESVYYTLHWQLLEEEQQEDEQAADVSGSLEEDNDKEKGNQTDEGVHQQSQKPHSTIPDVVDEANDQSLLNQEDQSDAGEADTDRNQTAINPPQQLRLEQAGVQRLTQLQPGRLYRLWLHAHATPTKFNGTKPILIRSYQKLPPLQLVELSAYSLTLAWAGTSDAISSLILECQSLSSEQLKFNVIANYTLMKLSSLQPKTRYSCRLAISYASTPAGSVYYTASQVYETLSDAPSAPGRPQLEHIAGEVFRVSWAPASENGVPIMLYNLEALQARRPSRRRRRRETSLATLPWAEEPQVIEDQWLDLCNTTELSCIVRDLHSRRLLLFRVRARNQLHGWGPFSEDSERIAEPFVSPEKRGSLVLAIIAPAAIVSSCVLALVLVRKVQKRRQRAKKLLQQSRPSIWSNLSTLQTQQQLMAARNRTFSMTLSDADIALLPQISWSRLTLLRFLGSGAFGEVYEGQLQGEDEAQPQRVAIKSLRKGASEFAELLQEAQLMSNFKHENIVCLIGICFDSDTISLIMEHMEAGDLLSYLRAARPNSQESPKRKLEFEDLLNMCLDVANGCSYLEDMHFVHRDLACRNCLVSDGAAIGGRRIVKIGDFGLARDIYKSDYYRKEGEGLLPVRWMALESLVDGLFSTQSDVWAFGVLCWEILTLGQQPYAARNNFEVLAHVKEGGRLQQPEQCPDKLYALLLQCWRPEPWERPSFRRCHSTLQSLSMDMPIMELDAQALLHNGNGKPEVKVRFDDAPERLSLQMDTKDTQAQTPPTHAHAHTHALPHTQTAESGQLYANESVSRL
ncbi:protein sevenless, partial [Drosophila navojoa]|uniref:protein sevenless n=1 Tax=Drosophila navojoa TaxID=7232 RepID=UPI0011BF546F